jgi:cytochrome P450
VLANSGPTFRQLRDLGDAVWVSKLDLFVVSRYRDVLASLRASDTLISGKGVSVNALMNGSDRTANVSTLNTDGELHHKLKRIEMRPLLPGAMMELRSRLEQLTNDLLDQLIGGVEFEAMKAFASYLPTKVVADLVGINDVGHERMLQWSGAIFDAFGPATHARTAAAIPTIQQFVQYGMGLSRADLVPGGWADLVLEAGERGELPMEHARSLIFDYVLPSLDTTIYSTGEMLYGLATTPDAFDKVRANPELIPGVINESVRLATPLRGFTRFVREDFKLTESTLPAGSRAWILIGSANRDERKYKDPDYFDVQRNPRDHVGWGHGVHLCTGMHLARLEMDVILRALVKRVRSMEAGTPTRIINNAAQGYATLPLRLLPAIP